MNESRINDRHSSYAKILMDGNPGYMRDISREGFKFVTPLPLSPETGSRKECMVMPLESRFDTFRVIGEVRWVKAEEDGFVTCGIRITEFETAGGEGTYRALQKEYAE